MNGRDKFDQVYMRLCELLEFGYREMPELHGLGARQIGLVLGLLAHDLMSSDMSGEDLAQHYRLLLNAQEKQIQEDQVQQENLRTAN